ncbi:MAG: DUF948 domain-containing protein [Desulfuromonadaceae bacterium]|nr:DUF948 domain-containing protein [Desulfuromonadaceae bacterium]
MPLIEIAVFVIAVAICLLVVFFIPMLISIKRAAVSVTHLTDMVQNELKPTLQELSGVLADLKTVGGGVAEHTEDVKCFMSALGTTGANIHTINRAVSVVSGVINATSAWSTGAKVAGKYLIEQYLKKRGGK